MASRTTTITMGVQAMAVLMFGLVGWYYPRYLIDEASPTIAQKAVPYQTTQAGDVILDAVYNRPVVEPPTIPSSFLIFTSVWIPFFMLILISIAGGLRRCRRDMTGLFMATSNTNSNATSWTWYHHDLHASVCGFIMAIGLSEAATHLLKVFMQQRRPNFYALCQFNATQRKCMAPMEKIVEANLTFPSGHSSLAACGMTFLVWYCLGKILLWSIIANNTTTASSSSPSTMTGGSRFLCGPRERLLACLVCLLPWSWALYVAATRVADYWHHPADVVAGLGLGGVTATLVYHVWYPPPIMAFVVAMTTGGGTTTTLLPMTASTTNNNTSGSSPINNDNNTTTTTTMLPGVPWSFYHNQSSASSYSYTGLMMTDTKLPSFHE